MARAKKAVIEPEQTVVVKSQYDIELDTIAETKSFMEGKVAILFNKSFVDVCGQGSIDKAKKDVARVENKSADMMNKKGLCKEGPHYFFYAE